MELMFAKRLRNYRRGRDLTQEELAQEIGISAQSVSKWERGDGYPDITLLPRIANYFGVTIDALLGNDELNRQEDIREYEETYREIEDETERVEYILSYVRKYPRDYRIALNLTDAVTELPQEKRGKYLPVLRESCEKIVNECTIQWIRENAIRDMCLVCPDDELEHWRKMCAAQYEAFEGEVIEKRLILQGRDRQAVFRYQVNNFYMLCHFLARYNHSHSYKKRVIADNRKKMKLLEFLGGGEGVPEVWRGRYAYYALEITHTLFFICREEEGYAWLERTFELYENWCALPEGTLLDTGDCDLFGGIQCVRGNDTAHSWDIILPDGSNEYFQEAFAYNQPCRTDIYDMLTRWPGTMGVCNDERMQPYIARAKSLAGIE